MYTYPMSVIEEYRHRIYYVKNLEEGVAYDLVANRQFTVSGG